MHIMEGFLPHPWWEIWFIIEIPFVAYGVYQLSKVTKKFPEAKPLLALMGAFIFVLSSLKLPSVTGSTSHPTGAGLAAVVVGPGITSVLSIIVLVFHAFLKFGAIFAITQIPIAIGEGILAVVLFDFLAKYKGQLLAAMKVIKL